MADSLIEIQLRRGQAKAYTIVSNLMLKNEQITLAVIKELVKNLEKEEQKHKELSKQ